METIEFSTSNRDRPVVIRHIGHIYNLERETDIKTFWRCNFFYKTKRKCRLQTIRSTMQKSLRAHNHLAEPENAEKQKANSELIYYMYLNHLVDFVRWIFHTLKSYYLQNLITDLKRTSFGCHPVWLQLKQNFDMMTGKFHDN